MNHPVKECIQKLGLTHRAFVVLYDISRRHRREGESMKRLSLDTALTLMRRENVLGHGFDLDELVGIFVKKVKDPMSREQVELSLAHYLAKSKHNDVVHRNQVLTKVARFLNQYDWQLSDDHMDYYKKYQLLFR